MAGNRRLEFGSKRMKTLKIILNFLNPLLSIVRSVSHILLMLFAGPVPFLSGCVLVYYGIFFIIISLKNFILAVVIVIMGIVFLAIGYIVSKVILKDLTGRNRHYSAFYK